MIGVIPMAFVGFVALRLAAISIATQSDAIDPRTLAPSLFLLASAFSWLGWVLAWLLERLT